MILNSFTTPTQHSQSKSGASNPSPQTIIIDHFHYDVTRAKVSGSCSKDRAQCRVVAGKCQKISRSAMSAKASYQVFHKVMCSIAIQIQRNSEWRFLWVFFR